MVCGEYQLVRLLLPSQSTSPDVTMAICFQAVSDSERNGDTFDTETYSIFLFALSVFLQEAVSSCFNSLYCLNHPTGLKNTK